MIQIFFGDDREKRNAAFHDAREKVSQKHGGATQAEFSRDSWDVSLFEQSLVGTSFFSEGAIVVGRDLLSDKGITATVIEILAKKIPEEAHLFFLEDAIPKDFEKKFSKRKDVLIHDFSTLSKKEARSTIGFDLARAIEKGNKKTAWILYQQAMISGMSAEELLWPLVWKVKDSLMKMGARRDAEFLKLTAISRAFVAGYHENKNGGMSLELAMEKLILEL
jgi:DNA polymerase III delta subunit